MQTNGATTAWGDADEPAPPLDDTAMGEPTSGRSRRRQPRRGATERISPRLTAADRAEVDAAAASAGMSTSRFCAEAAVAAARGSQMVLFAAQDREALARLQRQLFAARTEVARFGTNVNQAVAALNSTGQTPEWLERAVALVGRSVRRLDDLIVVVDRRLR